jgi:hypothetical protein
MFDANASCHGHKSAELKTYSSRDEDTSGKSTVVRYEFTHEMIKGGARSRVKVSTMRVQHFDTSLAHVIITIITDHCRMHHACDLSFILIQLLAVVIHRRLRLIGQWFCMPVQEVPKPAHTLAAEDAEDFALLLGKLWGSFATEMS